MTDKDAECFTVLYSNKKISQKNIFQKNFAKFFFADKFFVVEIFFHGKRFSPKNRKKFCRKIFSAEKKNLGVNTSAVDD